MKRYLGWCLAFVVALGVVASAAGGEGNAAGKTQIKTGVVKKVDQEGKKIVVTVARDLTFAITDDTKIAQGDAAKTLADVKVGDTVTVEYATASPGNRVAKKVTIGASAPAPATPTK